MVLTEKQMNDVLLDEREDWEMPIQCPFKLKKNAVGGLVARMPGNSKMNGGSFTKNTPELDEWLAGYRKRMDKYA